MNANPVRGTTKNVVTEVDRVRPKSTPILDAPYVMDQRMIRIAAASDIASGILAHGPDLT